MDLREQNRNGIRVMKKPSIYLDTSIVSAFCYEGTDPPIVARRLCTREWWDAEREGFAVWGSAFGEAELRAGTFRSQPHCLRMIRRLRYLPVTKSVRDLITALIDQGIVPNNKPGDAAHLAISTIHAVDYLLTWNYAHMANPVVQARLNLICERLDLVAPLMVSPETIPQSRYGQSIRRNQ